MARGDTLERTLRVIRLLELNPRGLTATRIEALLKEEDGIDVHIKTVRRDLDVIATSGFPVEKDAEGRYLLAPVATVSKALAFSYEELMALYLARGTFETNRGSAIFNHLRGFFDKLESALGPKAHKGLQELRRHVGIKPEPSWAAGVSQEVMDTVHGACAEGHLLKIEYRSISATSASSRVVGPEAIYFADAGAYLVAKDSDNVHKLFALARIRSAERLDDQYVSSGFDLSEFLKDGIGVLRVGEIQEVLVHVDEPIASYISERRWHESQVVTRISTGIELKLKVRVNDELARWVLGLGPSAEVLAPPNLRERVRVLASEICNRIDTPRKKSAS